MRATTTSLIAGVLVLTAVAAPVTAQDSENELTLPRHVQRAYDAGSRSLDGKPGPNYWQNDSVYDISVEVSPPDRRVTGTETITYTNSGPNPLPAIVVRLYLNAHLPGAAIETARTADWLTEGIVIDRFAIGGEDVAWEPILFGNTVQAVLLEEPLPPGESIELAFDWHYDLALEPDKEGVVDPTTFFLAYFFPRVSVASDTDWNQTGPGWDLQEFTYTSGREAWNDFGDYTVAVTVPKDYVVWATGELQNPDEVLQSDAAERLAASMTGDEVVTVATPEQLAAGEITAQDDTVTWRWQADHVNDFALGLSDHFVWDAGSVEVDPESGRRVSLQAAYPVEATEYETMVADSKDIITFGSTQMPGVPWPYPKATVFVGGADEEYPMMANDGISFVQPGLPESYDAEMVAAHEVFHTWMPFLLGTDERRYPILDEGMTTALEYLFGVETIGKEDMDAAYVAVRSGYFAQPVPGVDLPAITPADALRQPISSTYNAYGKGSMAYLALYDLLGEDGFRAGLQEAIARWEGKHMLPWDLFNTFDDVTDEDLDWFFHNWFFEPNYVDLAIDDVVDRNGHHRVRVANRGGFAVPFDVLVEYADGTTDTFHETPEVWRDNPELTVIRLADGKKPTAVAVDAGIWGGPEIAKEDNVWPAPEPATAG
jgi:hypothetical protein